MSETTTCPSCRSVAAPGAIACSACGGALPVAPGAPRPPRPERRSKPVKAAIDRRSPGPSQTASGPPLGPLQAGPQSASHPGTTATTTSRPAARAPRPLIAALVVVAVLTAGAGTWVLTRPAPGGRALQPVAAQTTVPSTAGASAAAPVATPSPGAPGASAAATPGTPTSAATGGDFAAELSSAQLRQLLLTPTDVSSNLFSVKPAGAAATSSPKSYGAGYTSPTSPSACRRALGLMSFSTADTAASPDWGRKSIVRIDDLRLRGSTLDGSQQVRQFASEADAEQFIELQGAWFDDCSEVTYRFAGGDVQDSSTVDDSTSPDVLLTSASDTGGTSRSEFDGWVRVGRVVYASYLLADGGTTMSQLQLAGRQLIEEAQQKLQQG